MDEDTPKRTLEEAMDDWAEKPNVFETWHYIAFFVLPALGTFSGMFYLAELDILMSSIIALAVMNGSINSVIAYLTIRLDDKSSEALDHLAIINEEMEKLEGTLDDANEMVANFTGDLNEAKVRFTQVGVDLETIDSLISKLKENETGITELLDTIKEIDITSNIEQAKRIDWKSLLDASEEVMKFIETRKSLTETTGTFSDFTPQLPVQEPFVPLNEEVWDEDEEEDPDWVKYSQADYSETPEPEPTPPKLTLTRDKPLTLKRR